MRKRMAVIFALAMTLVLVVSASASHVLWFQGFEEDTGGWQDSSIGWEGSILRVPSGTNDVYSSAGGWHAVINQGVMIGEPVYSNGPRSLFDDQYRATWPGTWIAEIDVYLDPHWDRPAAFDYTVSYVGRDGPVRRHFIFHIESYGKDDLRVGGTDKQSIPYTGKSPQGDLRSEDQIPEAGWYTLQHVFYDDGTGVLAVDMNVLDSAGVEVFTTTLSNPIDKIEDWVGGPAYSWFTFSTVEDLAIDNHQLYLAIDEPHDEPLDRSDCMGSGYEAFGFRNQGECIASVQSNENSQHNR